MIQELYVVLQSSTQYIHFSCDFMVIFSLAEGDILKKESQDVHTCHIRMALTKITLHKRKQPQLPQQHSQSVTMLTYAKESISNYRHVHTRKSNIISTKSLILSLSALLKKLHNPPNTYMKETCLCLCAYKGSYTHQSMQSHPLLHSFKLCLPLTYTLSLSPYLSVPPPSPLHPLSLSSPSLPPVALI